MALQHIAMLEAKAAALCDMSNALRGLADACPGDGQPGCAIIDALAGAAAP
jgi:hypothetical protein